MSVFSDFELTYLAQGNSAGSPPLTQAGFRMSFPPSWLSRTIL